MKEELQDISNHIKELGLGVLFHSLRHALQENFVSSNNTSHMDILGVVQMAHACELLIKARIAEEHPLLIFSELPKSTSVIPILNFKSLVESGKTFQYSELPERLWATTGYKFNNEEIKLYKEFGKLRNAIQHFATPENRDLTKDTLEFAFGVIERLINESWGLYVADYYVENPLDPLGIFPIDYENYKAPHNDIFNVLLKLNINFRVSQKYRIQVEEDVKRLNNLVKVIELVKELPKQDVNVDNWAAVDKFASQLDLPRWDVFKLYNEALFMLRNNTPYQEWCIERQF